MLDCLTFRQADAGASPRTACALAAIHSLVNRASAAYGGVREQRILMTKSGAVTMAKFFSIVVIMFLFVSCTVTEESTAPEATTPLEVQEILPTITPVLLQTPTEQFEQVEQVEPTHTATLVPTLMPLSTPKPSITPDVFKDSTPTVVPRSIESINLPDECYENSSDVSSSDEFLPCSDFQFSPDQRFLGFFYGPEYCIRGIIILDVQAETVIYKSNIGSGIGFEFLPNGKAFVTTGHCEGGQVNLFDPNTREIERLGGLGFGPGSTVWNSDQTAIAVSTSAYIGVEGVVWGYNVEKDFVFLSEATTWGIDDHLLWTPDGSHILYQHRVLSDGPAYGFPEARQIIKVNAETGEKQVLVSDAQYDYHLCVEEYGFCDEWNGDWIRVRRFPFEPQEIPFTDDFFNISEVTCLLYGKACAQSPELFALNWQTGQLVPWNEWVTPTPLAP